MVKLSKYSKYLFPNEKLSLSKRTSSSGLKENIIPRNFVQKIILYNVGSDTYNNTSAP